MEHYRQVNNNITQNFKLMSTCYSLIVKYDGKSCEIFCGNKVHRRITGYRQVELILSRSLWKISSVTYATDYIIEKFQANVDFIGYQNFAFRKCSVIENESVKEIIQYINAVKPNVVFTEKDVSYSLLLTVRYVPALRIQESQR